MYGMYTYVTGPEKTDLYLYIKNFSLSDLITLFF